MRKDMFKGITVLHAEDGAYITDGSTFTEIVYLGRDASEDDWRDATAEEYAGWQSEQESEELSDEEAFSIVMGESV